MTFEIKDLAGLSAPAERLIEVVSAGLGTLYRPRAIRKEADAKAYEMLKLAEAARTNRVEDQKADALILMKSTQPLTPEVLVLAERAKARLLQNEVNRQANLEAIADFAVDNPPIEIATDEVSPQWRDRFFRLAEDVSTESMQEIWGKILSGEVSKPGSYSVRTLEVLRNLSSKEANLFQQFSRLVIGRMFAVMALEPIGSPGLNSNLNFGFDFDADVVRSAGDISFNDILSLRNAGLLHTADGLSIPFALKKMKENDPFGNILLVQYQSIWLRISHQTTQKLSFAIYQLTEAGTELLALIPTLPHKEYLLALKENFAKQKVMLAYGTGELGVDGKLLIGNFKEVENLPD